MANLTKHYALLKHVCSEKACTGMYQEQVNILIT